LPHRLPPLRRGASSWRRRTRPRSRALRALCATSAPPLALDVRRLARNGAHAFSRSTFYWKSSRAAPDAAGPRDAGIPGSNELPSGSRWR
jgi:hypothetical protein